MTFTLDDIKWLADNAKRQMVGPMKVFFMAEAAEWYKSEWASPPTLDTVLKLAQFIEPNVNVHGFREHAIQVGSYFPPNWTEVPRLMETLINDGDLLAPDQWYREFEMIHPFGDGNGRTGAILWNGHQWRTHGHQTGLWVHPPDFYDRSWFN